MLRPGALYQGERTGTHDPFQIYFTHILPFGRDDGGLNDALARAWPLRMSMLHRPELAGIFERLFEAYATRTDDGSLAVRGLALQLLHVIFQELREAPSARPPRACLGLLRAKGLIEKEYARDLSLDEIAAHAGISASHLSALFTGHFGHPPIEYLVRVRLREAKLLLARGMLVKEAAHAVGFHSQHYFSRAFRQRTGLSPTEFAEQHARK
jgi:AraC-like DNA-binding protein